MNVTIQSVKTGLELWISVVGSDSCVKKRIFYSLQMEVSLHVILRSIQARTLTIKLKWNFCTTELPSLQVSRSITEDKGRSTWN